MAMTLTGVVTSNKTDKTIIVTVQSRQTHPLYKKQYSVTRKYMAHDEKNEASVGDKVVIKEVRPISKRKTWQLVKVVEKAREKMVVRDEVSEEFEPEIAEEKEEEK